MATCTRFLPANEAVPDSGNPWDASRFVALCRGCVNQSSTGRSSWSITGPCRCATRSRARAGCASATASSARSTWSRSGWSPPRRPSSCTRSRRVVGPPQACPATPAIHERSEQPCSHHAEPHAGPADASPAAASGSLPRQSSSPVRSTRAGEARDRGATTIGVIAVGAISAALAWRLLSLGAQVARATLVIASRRGPPVNSGDHGHRTDFEGALGWNGRNSWPQPMLPQVASGTSFQTPATSPSGSETISRASSESS